MILRKKHSIKIILICMVLLALFLWALFFIEDATKKQNNFNHNLLNIIQSVTEIEICTNLFLNNLDNSAPGFNEPYNSKAAGVNNSAGSLNKGYDFENDNITEMQQRLYNIDRTAYVFPEELDLIQLANKDMRINLAEQEPVILIFHTHPQEAYIDSRQGCVADTVVGMGETLAEILNKEYNIKVIHYTENLNHTLLGNSYEVIEPQIREILKQYPSIEIAIDLHRDGVPENLHFSADLNGKNVAQIMFFNGICRESNDGFPNEIDSLQNEFIEENLALSLQMKLKSDELYPGFSRKIYIKPYRYSLHMVPKSLLIEIGANTNTVEEAKSAMEPLAEILYQVILGQ